MIKTLQKRFVITAMAAVTLLLTVLISALNIANAIITTRQIDSLLDFITQSESMPHREPPFGNRRGGFIAPPFDEDTQMSTVYFTATVGETTSINVRRIATVDEAEALTYVEKAAAAGKADGRTDRFHYRVTEREGDTLYVFLDTTMQVYSLARLAVLSLLAGLVAFGLMLLLIVLLSKRAIRPIAENIDRQKQFVTDAGHELKTPIAIILANTEALELHAGESKWSKNIRDQAARLGSLTQNLLALSRADESQNKTAVEFSLSELVRDTAETFREPMEQSAKALFCEIEENVFLKADRVQTERVLSILLDNALRYAKKESEVTLTLHGTTFELCNECESLPNCPPEKLFDRFYRDDASRGSEGYGIGLSAAHSLVNGRIEAKYIGENKISFAVKFT